MDFEDYSDEGMSDFEDDILEIDDEDTASGSDTSLAVKVILFYY